MNKELFKTITDKLNFSFRHKTPVILQSEAAECGIACLAMVCGFYGLNIDLFNFRHRYGSPSQGVTLMSLSKTAEHAARACQRRCRDFRAGASCKRLKQNPCSEKS